MADTTSTSTASNGSSQPPTPPEMEGSRPPSPRAPKRKHRMKADPQPGPGIPETKDSPEITVSPQQLPETHSLPEITIPVSSPQIDVNSTSDDMNMTITVNKIIVQEANIKTSDSSGVNIINCQPDNLLIIPVNTTSEDTSTPLQSSENGGTVKKEEVDVITEDSNKFLPIESTVYIEELKNIFVKPTVAEKTVVNQINKDLIPTVIVTDPLENLSVETDTSEAVVKDNSKNDDSPIVATTHENGLNANDDSVIIDIIVNGDNTEEIKNENKEQLVMGKPKVEPPPDVAVDNQSIGSHPQVKMRTRIRKQPDSPPSKLTNEHRSMSIDNLAKESQIPVPQKRISILYQDMQNIPVPIPLKRTSICVIPPENQPQKTEKAQKRVSICLDNNEVFQSEPNVDSEKPMDNTEVDSVSKTKQNIVTEKIETKEVVLPKTVEEYPITKARRISKLILRVEPENKPRTDLNIKEKLEGERHSPRVIQSKTGTVSSLPRSRRTSVENLSKIPSKVDSERRLTLDNKDNLMTPKTEAESHSPKIGAEKSLPRSKRASTENLHKITPKTEQFKRLTVSLDGTKDKIEATSLSPRIGAESSLPRSKRASMENLLKPKQAEDANGKLEGDCPSPRRMKIKEGERENLTLEVASLKRALDGERSAGREQRAGLEAEGRRERAEARRREAALEGQLRAALRAPAARAPAGSEADKLYAALQAAKADIKALQEKLHVVMEADKRKAGELRAQHDAHSTLMLQMERDARTQTAKLLEELKSKERHLEQAKKVVRAAPAPMPKISGKMAVAEQLHVMEGHISRLESELQKRDDIIQSLRNSKVKRERAFSKENFLKETSDVDSAISSAPNSLSPQPSPDLWFRPQESSQDGEEVALEAAKRQVEELEKALSTSTANQRSSQLRASQLEEQLQDLREHADLLEFRCLELEDTNEKRNSLGELTDSDSGCTSPEDRLKNSVSPQLRRSDSGYKSPTHRPSSPNLKSQRILKTPTTSLSDGDHLSYVNGHKSLNLLDNLHLQDIDQALEGSHQSDDIRDKLERMLLKTKSEDDRNCLEQVLQLMWNLQAISSTLSDDDSNPIKPKKTFDTDIKNDFEHTKTSRIIATISPYSQNSDFTKSAANKDQGLVEHLIKEESKKLLFGLQESGIFEDSDWESKETQTELCDCVCTEPESDLATEVQRLNQIREQLEKSGAIRDRNLRNKLKSHEKYNELSSIDARQRKSREKKHLEYYENRISTLESKISIYESSEEIREKKLAQRLQKEIDLESYVTILQTDLENLQQKYVLLEEERCEFEEAENDTRLHCQELEAEFELLSAKLRDMDEQRSCAKNEADCYRALCQEYQDKSAYMQVQEKDLKERLQTAYKATFGKFPSDENLNLKSDAQNNNCSAVAEYLKTHQISESDPFNAIEQKLESLVGEKEDIQKKCREQENILRSRMADLEEVIEKNSAMFKKQEDEANIRIKALENDLLKFLEGSHDIDENFILGLKCDDSRTKLQEIMASEKELKQRIVELEKREVAFLETLNQGDELWAEMENNYKQKIKEYEDNETNLKEAVSKYESEKNKWKGIALPLEQKVRELEETEIKLESQLKKLEERSRELRNQKEMYGSQAETLKAELQQSKLQMKHGEASLKGDLSTLRKLLEELRVELKEQKIAQQDMETKHSTKVSQMKRELSKSHDDLVAREHKINEMREEVDNLEKQVTELTNQLYKQRLESDDKIISLLDELNNKTKEVQKLQRDVTDYQALPSAHEELKHIISLNSSDDKDSKDKDRKGNQTDKNTNYEKKCMCNQNKSENKKVSINKTSSASHEKPTVNTKKCFCSKKKQSTSSTYNETITAGKTSASVHDLSTSNNGDIDNTYITSICYYTSKNDVLTEENENLDNHSACTSYVPISRKSQTHDSDVVQSSSTPPIALVTKEKPALPKRKPKVSPRPSFKSRSQEYKLTLSNKSLSMLGSNMKRLSQELTNGLIAYLESKDNSIGLNQSISNTELGKSLSRIIQQTLDNHLDDSTVQECKELMSDVQELLPLLPPSLVVKSTEIDTLIQEKIEPRWENMDIAATGVQAVVVKELTKNPTSNADIKTDSSKVSSETQESKNGNNIVKKQVIGNQPIPAPRRDSAEYNNSPKQSSSQALRPTDSPVQNISSSECTASMTTSTKDLIASFNNNNRKTESQGSDVDVRSYVPYQTQSSNNIVGGLVMDRVTKLTNSINAGNSLIGLRRSVSMSADCKSTAPHKNYYIYHDL